MRISAVTLPRIAAYARSGRVVVFDTETTGCARDDEICQIAAAEYVAGLPTRTFSVYVRPTCEMNPCAEAIHGLSMEFLSLHGLAPEEAMRRFFAFLGDDALLVAHNSRFDLGMVDHMCTKFGLEFAPRGIETCDTLALARRLRPGLDSYRLVHLISALGVRGTNSHDALDDTLACAGLFFRLLEGT